MRELMFTVLALATLSLPAAAETRALSGFDNIHASGRFGVEVAVGPEFSVRAEGEDASRIRSRVEGDTLRLEPANRPWFGNPHYDVTFHITLPRLEGLSAERGAEVRAIAGGECNEFSAAAAMGGDVRVDGLQCASVDASAAMGAMLRLAGSCETLDATAAMGGELNAAALRCAYVDATAAMGGEVAAYASNTFEASAAMGGSVNVAGGGKPRGASASMGGTITQED